MGETLTHPSSRLSTLGSLLDGLHANSILYCLLGTKNDPASAFSGNATIEILFDGSQRSEIERILNSAGYKVFQSVIQNQYEGTTDFIGMDLPSGKIVHVRMHDRIVMGESYMRDYHFAHERFILNSRTFNEHVGTYCLTPSLELIMLFISEALKLRRRDRMRMLFGRNIDFDKEKQHKLGRLKTDATREQVSSYLQQMFKDHEPICELMMMPKVDKNTVGELGPLLRKELKDQQLHKPFPGYLVEWWREWSFLALSKISRWLGKPFPSKRINPRGGLVVAVVGADGSGKSTVTKNLEQTFDSKIDMLRIYFGRGDGRISLSRQLLRAAKHKSQPAKLKKTDFETSPGKSGLLKQLYKCIEAMLVAREKSKNLDAMVAARKKGMLVICDRFPQNQIHGYNDGPLLTHLLKSGNPLLSFLARQERRIYDRAQQLSPDIMIKLIAEPEIVEARKPGEVSLDKLRAKIEGIKALTPGGHCKPVVIDASRPLQEVLTLVKQVIWQNL